MRWVGLLLSAGIVASSGCSPLILASGARPWELNTQSEVHAKYGEPSACGHIDGLAYEDYRTNQKLSSQHPGPLMLDVATLGLAELYFFPVVVITTAHETVRGHDLRFVYGLDGSVKDMYIDGQRRGGGGVCSTQSVVEQPKLKPTSDASKPQ